MDRRDRVARYGTWYSRFDDKRMVIIVEDYDNSGINSEEKSIELEFPAKLEVCDTCEGKGKHVNPSIDSEGISAEEFSEDPDFAEEYMSGSYDVTCYECKGLRVVPGLNDECMSELQKKQAESIIEDFYDGIRENESERRYGC